MLVRESLFIYVILVVLLYGSKCVLGESGIHFHDSSYQMVNVVAGVIHKPHETGQMTWTRWEQTLTSSKDYANPYCDVSVYVVYNGPSNRLIRGYGFWDSGNNYKIRAMFPVSGKWSWKTTSSDSTNSGLHGQHGTVTVIPYSGNDHLYRKGYLKVSNNKRYLVYNDGTPFLWLGDTPWAALIGATQSEWETYIQKRKSQHFNVVQIHCRDGWIDRTTDRDGNTPFIGSGTSLRWNPLYWRNVDKKVQYANDQGLIVFFAAVRQPGPGVPETDVKQIRCFARNLAARMMGNFTVYSPVADDLWTSYADESAEELSAATSVHLITAHPRFKWEPTEIFHKKAYTDFVGLQSGAGWSYDPYFKEPGQPFSAVLAIRQAIEWPLRLYNMLPKKPLINLEAVYDWKALQVGDADHYEQPYPVRLPRSSAYSSLLSGAKGFTYGVGGVWNWGYSIGWGGPNWSFSEALNQPSGDQMQYLFEFFSGLEWWNLIPCHQLIKNQSNDWLKKMTMSKTPNGNLAVAYLPDNPYILIQLNSFADLMNARWFNPVTNTWQAVTKPINNSGTHAFIKPAGWQDAVLVLKIVPATPTH